MVWYLIKHRDPFTIFVMKCTIVWSFHDLEFVAYVKFELDAVFMLFNA